MPGICLLVLSGLPGSGKTTLTRQLRCQLHEGYKSNVRCLFIIVPPLLKGLAYQAYKIPLSMCIFMLKFLSYARQLAGRQSVTLTTLPQRQYYNLFRL